MIASFYTKVALRSYNRSRIPLHAKHTFYEELEVLLNQQRRQRKDLGLRGIRKENATFVQNSPQFVTRYLWQKYGEKREGF